MIVRIWHGRTSRASADEYTAYLQERALPDCRDAQGNQEIILLRRDEGDVSHFLSITRWDSEGDIRDFVGGDASSAKYYAEDRQLLLELEPEVQLYTVIGQAP